MGETLQGEVMKVGEFEELGPDAVGHILRSERGGGEVVVRHTPGFVCHWCVEAATAEAMRQRWQV